MDKTQHHLSNEGKKGGSETVRYSNPSFSQEGDHVTYNAHNIMGIYCKNSLKVIPPHYTFDTSQRMKKTSKLILIGAGIFLNPIVTLGTILKLLWNSFFSVQSKGSMYISLFWLYVTYALFPCYPNVSPVIEWDVNGHMLRGPVFLKVDRSPGHLSSEVMNIEFLQMFW